MTYQKLVPVKCLYCEKTIFMPKVKGVVYVHWPIVHEECSPERDKGTKKRGESLN